MEKVIEKKQDEKISERERSTIVFPYFDLSASIEVARRIYEVGGTSCEAEQLAAKLDLEVTGGGFRLRLSAARIYGLIAQDRGNASKINLTDLGRQIIDLQTEKNARAKAFLIVPLFSKVYEEYKGRVLPQKSALETALVNFGVGDKVKGRARQILEKSAKQAGFFDATSDRFVKPKIDENLEIINEPSNIENYSESATTISENSKKNQHPAFRLLLESLPNPNEAWDIESTYNWLLLAYSSFNFIYKISNGEQQIEIKLSKKN